MLQSRWLSRLGTSERSPTFWSGIHNPDPATTTLSVTRRSNAHPILCEHAAWVFIGLLTDVRMNLKWAFTGEIKSYPRYVDWLKYARPIPCPPKDRVRHVSYFSLKVDTRGLVPRQALTLGALPDSCQRTDVRIWHLESCICLEWLFWDKIP